MNKKNVVDCGASAKFAEGNIMEPIKHSRRFLYSMLLLALLSMLSCKEETVAPENGKGTLIGKVTQGAGGPVVEGAIVTSDGGETDVTDASGNYSIDVPAGTRTITVTKNGFMAIEQTPTVTSGRTTTLNFFMQVVPNGTVQGTVKDAQTNAVLSGAKVKSDTGDSTVTNTLGVYTLATPTGRRTVTVTKLGYITKADTTTVEGNTASTLNISLTAVSGTVQGTITDIQGGGVISGAKVKSDTGDSTVTNAQGMFTLIVPNGERTITVTKGGFVSQAQTVTITGGGMVTKDFSMQPIPPGTVTGRVGELQSGSGIADVIVRSDRGETATTNASGDYTLIVRSGSRQLTFTKEGFETKIENVTVTSGATLVLNVYIVAMGTVEGTITELRSGAVIAGATVKSDTGDSTITNSQGHYSFSTTVETNTITIKKTGFFQKSGSITVVAGGTVTFNTTLREGPSMIFVQGGTFQMGSTTGEADEQPLHTVTLSSFYIGEYEVTQQEWIEVKGSNPSYHQGTEKPVEQVSWLDAVKFCNLKSTREGFNQAYVISGNTVTVNWSANGYRLPTEAEWEYAARGGNNSNGYTYSGSNDVSDVAWNNGDSGRETHPVGTKLPNELGIYDMSGNVWEWCWDWYGAYAAGNQTNPTGSPSGIDRVDRGGSWRDVQSCRVAFRVSNNADDRFNNLGFRLVRAE